MVKEGTGPRVGAAGQWVKAVTACYWTWDTGRTAQAAEPGKVWCR